MTADAHHAVIRFGLGRRGEEPLPADPRGWLSAQGAGPDPLPPDPARPTVADALRAEAERRRNKGMPDANAPLRDIAADDRRWQADLLLTTAAPFRERLVLFWANHFTVSGRNGAVRPLAGAFVRDAIRPHVTGRFGDMLLAVMRHPAMLLYLNNAQSVGPDSPAGLSERPIGPAEQRTRRGLNENLARECLELHTVAAAAGYTQADVTAFARVLTGWSVQMDGPDAGARFRPRAHQPGPKTVMGQTVPEGEAGGVQALAHLAAHPATAAHVAAKLCRHFMADEPPKAAVRAVARAFMDGDGALPGVYAAVLAQPAAWVPQTKLRTPVEFSVAVLRALDPPPERRPPLPGVFNRLGQPLWGAPMPNGYPDRAADWSGPDEMLRRLDFAYQAAGAAPPGRPPEAVAAAALGPLLRAATTDAMRHAGSRREALALLLTSPEFQRR